MREFDRLSFEELGNFFPKNYLGTCTAEERLQALNFDARTDGHYAELFPLTVHSKLRKIQKSLKLGIPNADAVTICTIFHVTLSLVFKQPPVGSFSKHKGGSGKDPRWEDLQRLLNKLRNDNLDLDYFFKNNSDIIEWKFRKGIRSQAAKAVSSFIVFQIRMDLFRQMQMDIKHAPLALKVLEQKGFNTEELLAYLYDNLHKAKIPLTGLSPKDLLVKTRGLKISESTIHKLENARKKYDIKNEIRKRSIKYKI